MAPSLNELARELDLPIVKMRETVLRLKPKRTVVGGQEVVVARVKEDVETHKAIVRPGQNDEGLILTIQNSADAYEPLEGPLKRVMVDSIGE